MTSNLDAQDFTDISTLYAVYNQASNDGRPEAFADCFTTDAVLVNKVAGHDLRGRDALLAYKAKEAGTRAGEYRRHWTGSLLLHKVADGSVHGRCYLLVFAGATMTLPDIIVAGVYADRIVRVDGEWKFAARTIHIDGRRGAPDGS